MLDFIAQTAVWGPPPPSTPVHSKHQTAIIFDHVKVQLNYEPRAEDKTFCSLFVLPQTPTPSAVNPFSPVRFNGTPVDKF